MLQIWVAQGFSHEMKIEIVRIGAQLLKGSRKVERIHGTAFALGPGTEGTTQVAPVGNLQIDLSESLHSWVPFKKIAEKGRQSLPPFS